MARSHIRSLELHDLPEVAALFLKVFRGRVETPPSALIKHLQDVYFGHPAHDPSMGSLVHERSGNTIDGFVGAFPQPMMLHERSLRGVIIGCFMVDRESASPTTGARLARRILKGSQDLTIIDTANRRSLDFQRVLGFQTLDLQSLQWVKIFEPASYALALGETHLGHLQAMSLRPLARIVDGLSTNAAQRCTDPAGRVWCDADTDAESFASIFEHFARGFELRPAWTKSELLWLLGQARRKTGLGDLFMRRVHDSGGELAGAYLYFGKPRREAVALQVVAAPEKAELVLKSLFAHAADLGCIAVRGGAQPFLMPGLFRCRRIIFRHESGTHILARDAALQDVIRGSRVLIGGLVGEGWTRLVSDDFSQPIDMPEVRGWRWRASHATRG